LIIHRDALCMYITLSNIQNGSFIPLDPVLDNREGNFEIALSEILYTPAWANISADYENNVFTYAGKRVTIPDGYYDVCALDDVFKPAGLQLKINPATGLLSILGLKNRTLFAATPKLLQTLGIALDEPPSNGTYITGTMPHNLIIYKELFVHLDEGLSTSENRHRGLPSSLLRAIHVKTERCGGGRAETFTLPQFKRLENGVLSGIKISVRDQHNQLTPLSYLSCVLEIRQRGAFA
jgi:hypothetical protein